MSGRDLRFDAMGSHVRLLVDEPGPGMEPPEAAVELARGFVVEFEAALSRFMPGSELCAFNADPRRCVPASDLLRAAVKSGIAAAGRSAGLVDPTLIGEIEAAGYGESRTGIPGAPLAEALAAAPARRPAQPSPRAGWRQFEVDDETGTICRPPGLRFDTGGIGKGLAADLIARRLDGYSRYVVDCGGDIRIGGTQIRARPHEIYVEHPLTGERAHVLRLRSGGVATSGLNVRIWRGADGSYAHHLLDPSTGASAWTGLIGATALASTTAEAETLSKAALLSGPDGGREVLATRGGLLVHDSGWLERVGPLSAPPTIRFPARAAA